MGLKVLEQLQVSNIPDVGNPNALQILIEPGRVWCDLSNRKDPAGSR
jgi:hypothetical protein